MSAPPGDYPPSEPAGAILPLWVAAAAFGNVFAISILVYGLFLQRPRLLKDLRNRLCCGPRHPSRHEPGQEVSGKKCSPSSIAGVQTVSSVDDQPAVNSITGTTKKKDISGSGGHVSNITKAGGDGLLLGQESAVQALQMKLDAVDEAHVLEEDEDEERVMQMSKGVKRVALRWSHITVTVRTAQGVKTVLSNVSGVAPPGQMMALMGPSGAGKSTLLDALAMRTDATINGKILVNGHHRSISFLQISAYVPQEDNFLPQMSVEEVLLFYARIKLPAAMVPAAKNQRVKEVLAALGLTHQRNTLVGGVLPGGLLLRGISGGERRRLGIGAGIVSRPSLIFLDEPTSGLDSLSALVVMKHLYNMARAGHTIVTSIHQPRAAIWTMFDRVLLLSYGLTMYEGPTDGMVPWFTQHLKYSYDAEEQGVASDWVMDLVCVGFDRPREAEGGSIMETLEELEEAADRFEHFRQQRDDDQPPPPLQLRIDQHAVPVPGIQPHTHRMLHEKLPQQLQLSTSNSASGVSPKSSAVLRPSTRECHDAAADVCRSSNSHGGVSTSVAGSANNGSGAYAGASGGFAVGGSDSLEAPGLSPAESCADSMAVMVSDSAGHWLGRASYLDSHPALGGGVSPSNSYTATGAPSAVRAAAGSTSAIGLHGRQQQVHGYGGGGGIAYHPSSGLNPGRKEEGHPLQLQTVPSEPNLNVPVDILAQPFGHTEPGHGLGLTGSAAGSPSGVAADSGSSWHLNGGMASANGTANGSGRLHGSDSGLQNVGRKDTLGLGAQQGWTGAVRKAWVEYRALLWREYLAVLRNPTDAAGRMLTFVWVALVSNYLTYGLTAGAESIRIRMSLLFALVFFFLVMPFVFMSLFTADKANFLADATAKLYRPGIYYLAKVSATLPLNSLIALLFSWIFYGMLGMRHSVLACAQFTVCAVLLSLIALQWLHFSTALSTNQDVAFILAVAFAVVNLIISTFFLGGAALSLPQVKKLRYLSALDYAWQGMMTAEFRHRTFDCSKNIGTDALGFTPQVTPSSPQFAFLRAVWTNPGAGCIVDTDALLEYMGINTNAGALVGYLFAYLAVLHIATFLALVNASRRKGAH